RFGGQACIFFCGTTPCSPKWPPRESSEYNEARFSGQTACREELSAVNPFYPFHRLVGRRRPDGFHHARCQRRPLYIAEVTNPRIVYKHPTRESAAHIYYR